MKSIEVWLSEYSESHQNPVNKSIHWICVPLIMLSVIGFLWTLPLPLHTTTTSPLLNWSILLILFSVGFYFFISAPLAVGMIIVSGAMVGFIIWLSNSGIPLRITFCLIFIVAWIGQFIGHHIEGKKPSFFKDVQFLLIGPLWLLATVYKRFDIKY